MKVILLQSLAGGKEMLLAGQEYTASSKEAAQRLIDKGIAKAVPTKRKPKSK